MLCDKAAMLGGAIEVALLYIIHSLYEFIVFLYKMMKIGNCEFVHLLMLFEIEGK